MDLQNNVWFSAMPTWNAIAAFSEEVANLVHRVLLLTYS